MNEINKTSWKKDSRDENFLKVKRNEEAKTKKKRNKKDEQSCKEKNNNNSDITNKIININISD